MDEELPQNNTTWLLKGDLSDLQARLNEIQIQPVFWSIVSMYYLSENDKNEKVIEHYEMLSPVDSKIDGLAGSNKKTFRQSEYIADNNDYWTKIIENKSIDHEVFYNRLMYSEPNYVLNFVQTSIEFNENIYLFNINMELQLITLSSLSNFDNKELIAKPFSSLIEREIKDDELYSIIFQ